MRADKLRWPHLTEVPCDMATEWLKIMLEEIQRRRDDARRASEEEEKRRQEQSKNASPPRAAR